MHPDQVPNLQPRHVPWPGIEPATLHPEGQCPTNWVTPARARDGISEHIGLVTKDSQVDKNINPSIKVCTPCLWRKNLKFLTQWLVCSILMTSLATIFLIVFLTMCQPVSSGPAFPTSVVTYVLFSIRDSRDLLPPDHKIICSLLSWGETMHRINQVLF